MNINASERSSHPSLAQIESLLEFLERNPDLAKGFSKTQNARERNKRKWEELALRLNSMGGATKSHKQWNKYWSDKKSTVKKKVAARAADRRRTGGGLAEDVDELSQVEERIVALCGGEGFGIGDAHLGIPLFPENVTSLPHSSQYAQNIDSVADSETVANPVSVPEQIVQNRQTARRLFISSDDIFDSGPSQSILHDLHQAPCPSPPPLTLSHTPSPQLMPLASPSRRGATATNNTRCHTVIASRGDDSSTSRAPQPPTPQPSTTPAAPPEASPSRRGATRTDTRRSSSVHTGRGLASSSRTMRPVATPPSQRRTEFARITERFLRVEEQQLEIQQSNARVMQALVERSLDCDRVTAEAVAAVGEGLKALAEAVTRN